MKLIGKYLEKDRSGYITMCPEEAEDMWHIYNILQVGDLVKAGTVRRVTTETTTGSVESSRVRINLTIKVEGIDFDSQAAALHINGPNTEENKYVKLGAYHTLDLELNQRFTLAKPEWDTFALEKVQEACDVARRADVAAIVLQEGLANLCLLTEHMTLVRQRIEVPVPRKRKGSTTNYEKGLARFYDQVYRALLLHIDFGLIKALIIASPGFVKDQFMAYMMDQATKTNEKVLFENRDKFLLIHCSSGHKHALQEVMQDPTVRSRLADTKATREIRTLEDFYKMLNDDADRAYYGYEYVARANEQGAVDRLLITDELFRSSDIKTRKKYIELVEQVRANGGKVLIFSSLHVSGEQLGQLTGVAAVLKFPLPELDVVSDGEP
ncbi:pelota [Dimargaris cristalligena]|uniref:Protein DOM34 homolog n=1 Tax=Dimargaris cristalligena TaxID=215637 RepID=A0A4P9ZWV1_9FUNG|nr:pelota [Dimargaris cristalligena]|eukprot:RKP38134.1 pelota [Dimargaris cristalligena]